MTTTSLLIGINGLFTQIDPKATLVGHYTNNLPSTGTGTGSCSNSEKMVGISVHENVLNSASTVYFNVSPRTLKRYAYWVLVFFLLSLVVYVLVSVKEDVLGC